MKTSIKQAKWYPGSVLFGLVVVAGAFLAGRFSAPAPPSPQPTAAPSPSAPASVELRIQSAGVRVLPDASIDLPPLPKLDIDLRQSPSASTTQPKPDPMHRSKKSMDKTGR